MYILYELIGNNYFHVLKYMQPHPLALILKEYQNSSIKNGVLIILRSTQKYTQHYWY